MKKNLLTIGLLALGLSVQAQTVLMHVDNAAKMYVSKGTLVYNGGGLQTKGGGNIENHGNFMISGNNTSDVFRNLDGTTGAVVTGGVPGTFVNKLNEETAFASRNTPTQGDQTSAPNLSYTYGQLYISGLTQDNIRGVVNQEFASVNHGSYQQIGFPFWDKSFTSLSELGKTFNNTRYSQNEALIWSNPNTVFDNISTANVGSTARPAYSYYILGAGGTGSAWASTGLNTKRTLVGRPVSDQENTTVTLSGAGLPVSYGVGGNAVNAYNEKYNSYLGDFFAYSNNNIWDGTNFGKNLYFFANPYLTNLDLNGLINPSDPNYISNLRGIRFEPTAGGTTYVAVQGGSVIGFKNVSRAGNVWTGDTEYLNVRPFGTFVIKLNSNIPGPTPASPTLNFANLRRFNYNSKAFGTPYSVTAAKNGQNNNVGTVKQLGVIGLDSNGNELVRTYFVVSPNSITGYSPDAKTQVGNSNTYDLGTYEENPTTGGYDMNYKNSYWLYINEANENFVGKAIKMVRYTSNISQFKFYIKEDGAPINTGSHALSSGIGFYFKGPDGVVKPLNQEMVLAATGSAEQEYDLYYGQPNSGVLASSEVKSPTRTVVVYNPPIDDYIVRFDPKWKKADIQVYDMSGKLIISEKNVDAGSDYTIKLQKSLKAVYVVKVVSDKGEIVQTKIER